MRTTIDLPDPLLRRLKSRAALESTTLKHLLRTLIERGLQIPAAPPSNPGLRSTLPSVSIGRPLRQRTLSNAALSELASE
jgi:hypothetical protein